MNKLAMVVLVRLAPILLTRKVVKYQAAPLIPGPDVPIVAERGVTVPNLRN